MIEYIAILVYGVLTIVGALILSSQVGSPIATAFALGAAGLTYLFQVAQLHGLRDGILTMLHVSVVAALLASVVISLWSAL